MGNNISLLRINLPGYAQPVTFRMMFEHLGVSGAIAGLAVGTIWAVFISERVPSSAFWISLIQVCLDAFRGFGIGSLLGAFTTFVVWHLLWFSALLRLFLPLKHMTAFGVIVLLTIIAYLFFSGRQTFAETILFISACLLTIMIFIWRIRILEQQLNQKPKNEAAAKVKEQF